VRHKWFNAKGPFCTGQAGVSGILNTRPEPWISVLSGRVTTRSTAPAAGQFDTSTGNSITGPSFHVSLAATRTSELRLEVFKLFNTFNWGSRAITSRRDIRADQRRDGDPRIMQFGIEYDL
jgi:hypothetical protein